MSFPELKEKHAAATATVNSLRERLKQRRQQLLDTDVARYTRTLGRTAVNFSSTDLVCCRTLQGHTGKVYSLDWTPERNRIVSASQDGRLIIWNALTSQKTHAIKLSCAWVMTCAFAPNGHSVSCGGLDSACSIFNLNSQVDRDGNIPVSQVLIGHKGYVSSCQYVPDRESHLVTSSGDQTCVLWDVTTGQRISIFGGEFPSGHTSDVLRSEQVEFLLDPEIDRTYRRRLKDQRLSVQEEIPNIMAQKSLKDYAAPQARGMTSRISLPVDPNSDFELKSNFIPMIQQNTFGGGPHEDSNLHLEIFTDHCNTVRPPGANFDILRLKLITFSLTGNAKAWYYTLPPNSLTSWEQFEQAFLNKFYPPSKTAHMRHLISSFTQFEGESLFEAWDRFKGMLRKCPHHGLEKWLILHTFYNGINYQTKVYLDSAAGGALMNKSLDEAEEIIENVALNHHQWASQRVNIAKTPDKYDVDALTKMSAQMDALSKKVEAMGINKVNVVAVSCAICGDSGHATESCQLSALQAQIDHYEQCDAVDTFNQRNNPYSNTYNPGWKNHPNFSYHNQGPSYSNAPKQIEDASDSQKILKMLENIQSEMVKVNEKLDDHDKRMKMQETQIAQISSSLSSKPAGSLPGKFDFNPMEHCKAIELRSGRTLTGKEPQVTTPLDGTPLTLAAEHTPSSVPCSENVPEEVETAPPAGIELNTSQARQVPFPQRLLNKKRDEEFEKLYNRVKDITLDVPLLDALVKMPSFAKFIRGLMSTKRFVEAKDTVALTEEVSAKILNTSTPLKLKDPGSFFLPCLIENFSIERAFCDLGASVSIMPISTCKRLGFTDLKLTTMAIQLADHSCRYPLGIAENVPVQVGRFTIPTDFVVLDIEEDPSIPIILGRPFLATADAKFDVKDHKLSIQVGEDKIEFHPANSSKIIPEESQFYKVDFIEAIHCEEYQWTPPTKTPVPAGKIIKKFEKKKKYSAPPKGRLRGD